MSNCSTAGPLDSLRQDDYELLARLAQRYYIDEQTQDQVAREFGLSRQKAQRLLKRARQAGVVAIHIEAPSWLRLDLESELRETFGLEEAVVAVAQANADADREAVAQRAARYLERQLRDGSVVAVGHGRTASAVARFFRPVDRLAVTFVSAMGGSPGADAPTNPNEVCRALAQGCGGRAESLYAPAYVEDAGVRSQLLAQAAVRSTLDMAAGADLALVGIGGVDDDCTMVRSGCLSREEVTWLGTQGAVGDVLGHYVDLDGRPLASPHHQRLVALPVEHLRRVKKVVAVASEPEKPAAVLGILRSGVVDVLVVDETNARAVLQAAARPRAGTATGRAPAGPMVPATRYQPSPAAKAATLSRAGRDAPGPHRR